MRRACLALTMLTPRQTSKSAVSAADADADPGRRGKEALIDKFRSSSIVSLPAAFPARCPSSRLARPPAP